MHTPWRPMDWRTENYTKWRELFQYILYCLDIVWHDVLSQSVSLLTLSLRLSNIVQTSILLKEQGSLSLSLRSSQSPGHSSWDSSIKNVKFSVYGQFGGKRMAGARCCELITLGFVSFVCDECEYTQSNLLSRPRLARRMKKWNSSEHSIHVLMSKLNDSVFKNCLTKRKQVVLCILCCRLWLCRLATWTWAWEFLKWSAQIVVLFHPFKSWQFQTNQAVLFLFILPPAIFCWITFSHLVEFISKWN